MFKTIFTVTKKTCGSTDFRVYFEDFDKAKKFAENESKKLSCGIVNHYGHHYPDGSFLYEWYDNSHEISFDDYAWVTDWRVNKIGFYDNQGLLTEFQSYDDLQKFILQSQKYFIS